MRFGFVTCVQLGLSCMEAIYDVGGKLDLVLTLEDDMAQAKSGRVYLDEFFRRNAAEIVKVRNINHPDAIQAIRTHEIDWLFIIGWSQIARSDVLNAPAKGVIGIHPTLLPTGRGRAAIPWAILKGLEQTGVTMFKLDEGVDTGPIIAQHAIPLTPQTDAGELYRAVDSAHIALMKDVFPKLQAGRIEPRPQEDTLATEWPGRKPEDGRFDMSGSVIEAERLVRAVTKPYPGAYIDRDGERLVVWRARIVADRQSAGDGAPVLEFKDGLLQAVEWDSYPIRD